MEKLVAGVRRFRSTHYARNYDFFKQLAGKLQKPIALFITCSDSRVDPNLLTQTEPGDLFIIRNAGNIVPAYGSALGGEEATVEYSIEVLGVRNVVVCGHSQCGAMQALLDFKNLDHLPAVKSWCAHAEATRRIVQQKYRDLGPADMALAAVKENVLVQMNNLSTHPCIAARLAAGELNIYGWYYDIGAGQILQFDEPRGRFFELSGEASAAYPLSICAPDESGS